MTQKDKQLWLHYKAELKINEEVIQRIKAKDESVLTDWNFDSFEEGLQVFEDERNYCLSMMQEIEDKYNYDEDEELEQRMELERERADLCYSQGLCY